MASSTKYQARKVIDTLYDLLFDGKGYVAAPERSADHCVKCYVDGEELDLSGSLVDTVREGINNVKERYASLAQDHAVAVVTSATSAVATIATNHDHIGAATTGIPGQGYVKPPSSTFFDNGHLTGAGEEAGNLFSTLRVFFIDPTSAFDNLLGRHSPLFDSLLARFGLNELARSLNADPRILLLALLLPLIVILLSACFFMGAGHAGEEPHAPGYHDRNKLDPTQVKGQGARQGSSSGSNVTRTVGTSDASSSSSSASGGKGKGKGKKGGTRDDDGRPISAGAGSKNLQLASCDGISSWGAMLGSNGFCGADVLDFKPFDIYPAMDSGSESRKRGDDIAIAQNTSHSANTAKKLGNGANDANIENEPEHIAIKADNTGKKGGPAGSNSESTRRIRIPRPHSVKEADRHRHQPHIPLFDTSSPSSSSSSRQQLAGLGDSTPGSQRRPNVGAVSKIGDFVQGNTFKNLDGIFGGTLSATLATAAIVAHTAEATTAVLKQNIPTSVS
ncbi:hypothetical protein BG004_002953, partial [Podila humilis]